MRAPIYFNWPGKVWLFSDPHFGDRNILKFERSIFNNIEDHDQYIIDKINNTTHDGDTLVCLGDLGHEWTIPLSKIKRKLYLVLIMGNHDRLNKTSYTKHFSEVYSGPLFVNKFMVLSHEPTQIGSNIINIHGHLHSATLDSKNHINISFAVNNYELADYDKLYRCHLPSEKTNKKFLEEWYADLYKFDSERGEVFTYNDGKVVPKVLRDKIESTFINDGGDPTFLNNKFSRFAIKYTDTIDSVVKKMLLNNEKFNSTMYGVLKFRTSFSGRPVDSGSIIKFERMREKYYITDIIYKDYALRSGIIDIDTTKSNIILNTVSSEYVNININAVDAFKCEDIEMENFGDDNYRFSIKPVFAKSDQDILLLKEVGKLC